MTMGPKKVAELVSSIEAVIAILLCFGVVLLWDKAARKALKNKIKTSEEWFIIGVYFLFMSISIEYIYILIMRTSSFLESGNIETLKENRIFFNIVFKHALAIFSAYCHIRAAMAYRKESHRPKAIDLIFRLSVACGLIYGVFLVFGKYGM